MKIWLVLILIVLCVACNEEYPNEEINKVRTTIYTKWQQWRPVYNEPHLLMQNQGMILEGEGNQVCHYIYPEIEYKYTLKTAVSYNIDRLLKIYTLGDRTTADPNYCHSRASIAVNEKIQDDYKLSYLLLYLDKVPANTSLPIGNITINNFKAIPTNIVTSSRFINDHEIGVYKLTYNLEGVVNQGIMELLKLDALKNLGSSVFKGTCEVTFATEVVPGAFVLSIKAEGEVDGVYYSESYQNVTVLDGVIL